MFLMECSAFMLLLLHCSSTIASNGDYSNEFRGCYHTCHFNRCSSEKTLGEFSKRQSISEKLLQWSCDDECRYNCMWHTTDIFIRRGWNVPQFYGKWPFIRVYGMQEPASVLFSLLNFVAQFYSYNKFRYSVPKDAPFFLVWTVYYWVCLHAWLWSVVFHARDVSLTEKMDYFCAFSMVLFSLLALLIRISGRGNVGRKIAISVCLVLFFFYHVWYLSTRSFDYGYNMKVNVAIGLINGFGWLIWSWKRPDERPYLFWCRVTVVALGASVFLELMDFAPLLWVFDAHALWHLSTSVLPLYWCRFMVGDCMYLLDRESSSSVYKKKV